MKNGRRSKPMTGCKLCQLRHGIGVEQVVVLKTRSDLRGDNVCQRNFPFGRAPWLDADNLDRALDPRARYDGHDDERGCFTAPSRAAHGRDPRWILVDD